MRPRVVVLLTGCLLSTLNTAVAQNDSASHPAGTRVSPLAWIVPVGIAASVALDPEAREWALRGHTRSLDHFAKAVNPLGTTQRLVPAMAITYVGALLTHHESLATGTLTTAAAYAASDLVESALKPVVGRERPDVQGNSHRFHPFSASGNWHSFPSAHVAHIVSIAAAVSEQTHSQPISVLGDILVTVVGWAGVDEAQHWTSDVAATAVLSTLVSRATVRWLQSRQSHSSDAGYETR